MILLYDIIWDFIKRVDVDREYDYIIYDYIYLVNIVPFAVCSKHNETADSRLRILEDSRLR